MKLRKSSSPFATVIYTVILCSDVDSQETSKNAPDLKLITPVSAEDHVISPYRIWGFHQVVIDNKNIHLDHIM